MPKRMIAIFACAMAVQAASGATMVKIDNGALRGETNQGVSVFKGIPYAAPPVGELRWHSPRPPASWQGVRDATKFASSCAQPQRKPSDAIPWTAEYLSDPPFSEDCLYLNVWTPKLSARANLPVVVWIHGGGFAQGSGEVPLYRGDQLARQGVVVVSINYRLGLFGFLAHPSLDAENDGAGVFGLMDQVAALRWVKSNITRFGGDPSRVTVQGQSAGAISVHHLLATPSAEGLFSGAIAESNSWSDTELVPKANADDLGLKLAELANAADVKALREVPTDKLVALQTDPRLGKGARFQPADAGGIPFREKLERSNVPVLLGSNQDEASAFSPAWMIETKEAYRRFLDERYQSQASQFSLLYPVGNDADASAKVRELLADSSTAAVVAWSEGRSEHAAPAYGYRFVHPEPGPRAARFGTFHSSEIPYVFATLDVGNRPFTDKDRTISHVMQAYWVNFIKTGNPNGAGLLRWPQLNTGNFMLFGDRQTVTPLLEQAHRQAFRAWLRNGGSIGLF